MTQVLITVDTELSMAPDRQAPTPDANIASSILGQTSTGAFGVGWLMDRMDDHGLKGIFFVDPFPALVHGESMIADIIGPIVARGHEVQLHIHTEWLALARQSPVEGRQGRNIGDFSLADQITLLALARSILERAGAPAPIAFRAGNFGANDDTLRALAQLGIPWDSSVNPAFLGQECRVTFDPDRHMPAPHLGVVELPVSGVNDRPGHFRAAQICALSSWEMGAALRHAARHDHPLFTIVTHSFEMLSRDRQRPNGSVIARFEALCRTIAGEPELRTAGFADLDRDIVLIANQPRLPPNRLRTLSRMGEQLVATLRYERRWRPA